MSCYADRVLPRLIDLTLRGAPIDKVRRRAASGLSGEVLEIGFGSGRNVPFYPAAVTRVRAVDPAVAGQRLAAGRLAASSVPVEFIGLDGQRLPLEPDSVDHVLMTWTLCTIPDAAAALAELRRVLRPGGQLHFAEHGRSPDPQVARRQDRYNPVQRKLAGGCELNRPIAELITGSGLRIVELDTGYMSGLKVLSYLYQGVASMP